MNVLMVCRSEHNTNVSMNCRIRNTFSSFPMGKFKQRKFSVFNQTNVFKTLLINTQMYASICLLCFNRIRIAQLACRCYGNCRELHNKKSYQDVMVYSSPRGTKKVKRKLLWHKYVSNATTIDRTNLFLQIIFKSHANFIWRIGTTFPQLLLGTSSVHKEHNLRAR